MIRKSSNGNGNRSEQLVVRWRTCGKTKGKGTGPFYKGIGASDQVDKITEFLGGGKGEDDLLASCYRIALDLAAAHKLASIAFPAISTGHYIDDFIPTAHPQEGRGRSGRSCGWCR